MNSLEREKKERQRDAAGIFLLKEINEQRRKERRNDRKKKEGKNERNLNLVQDSS